MYCDFYIDQFLLEQFFTEGLLLMLAAVLCRKTVSIKNLITGSAAGAVSVTLLVIMGAEPLWPVSLVLAAAGAFVVSFPGNSRSETGRGVQLLLKTSAALLFVTVCFGGTLEAVNGLPGISGPVCSAAAALLLKIGFEKYLRRKAETERYVSVKLCWSGRSVETEGLIDTGNHLREPLTGRPVSVAEPEIAGQLLGENWEMRRGYFLIPYCTIGRKQGWMRAVTIDRMYVKSGEKVSETTAPILAISDHALGENTGYHVILHPLHIPD